MPKRVTKTEENEIIKLHKEGRLLKDISSEVGRSLDAVRSCLKRHNLKIDNHTLKYNEEEIVEYYYKESAFITDISIKFNLSHYKIKQILKKNGIMKWGRKHWDINNDIDIIDMYKNGYTIKDICEKYNFAHSTISAHLARLGILDNGKQNTSGNTGYKLISGVLWSRLCSTAARRTIELTITKEYINDLFVSQNQQCALSGVTITLPRNHLSFQIGDFTASLDRIDSAKGYIEGNVQWVHKKANIMKQDMKDKEFIKWCNIISKFNSE